MQTCCAIPIAHVGRGLLFVTLTYPKNYPGEWHKWKAQLHHVMVRLGQKFPMFGAVWKLEPQKRGAPHFHLLVVGVPFIAKEWLSRTWYDVVGSRDEKHLRAGTQVELARSHRGVVSYAAKYVAKRQALPADWQDGVGRWWGMVGRRNVGIVWKWAPLSQHQYYAAARIVRGLVRRRSRSGARGSRASPFSGTWAVLPDWQALRIALCVLDTENSAGAYQPHARTPDQTVREDCLFRRHRADQRALGCVCVWTREPLRGAPVAPT
jgi:hypothetical protein